MTNIILFGNMGSGKDSVAEYIIQHGFYRPVRLGKYIRQHVNEMFEDLGVDERRPHYQAYGEGMREIFGENIWNELAYNGIIFSRNNIVVDARQPHELAYWTERGYIPVAVDVTEENRLIRIQRRDGDKFNPSAFTHPTEERAKAIVESIKNGEIKGYVIDNNGIIENTHNQIDDMLRALRT